MQRGIVVAPGWHARRACSHAQEIDFEPMRARVQDLSALAQKIALSARSNHFIDRREYLDRRHDPPINKVAGSSGQRDFLRKRGQILNSSTHWLEIDLLRAGTRPPGVPSWGDYDAALQRAGSLNRLDAWFASLREPLPTVAVSLQPPFEDVPLDLQEVVGQVYDRYRYDTAIDYTEEPPAPPLREADAAWGRERVTAWRQGRAG